MKTGLFFGSFNPIHLGHLIIAEYMAEFTDLDEVLFIVSPQNPLKAQETLADENDRLEMVRLAVGNHPKIKLSDVEYHLPRPSYTIQTLQHLQKEKAEQEFILIVGEDSLSSFNQWKNYEQILDQFQLYVYPRIKSASSSVKHQNIKMITEAPMIEISASFIRQSIKAGKDVQYMLPINVWKYIGDKSLYI
jgi:nicotinate-nucleotide adenylyltransferase